ncbi:MAG: hypothetical protein KC420_16490 [Myxococcales bacterium]|nr:hypothetical protein [Myxococcales bacterium]MCB9568298.1 hypothetical protein [Myxococcales bacterium]MCB9705021.1 hypothetical protein [Myxococcales bacterium]
MRRPLTLLLTLLVSLAAAPGCATKVQAPTEAPALGSDATIVAKKNKTGTYDVSIAVQNLAPPARLDEGSTAFVVWLIAGEQPAVRVGALDYDEGDRAGALEVTSPDAAFNVLITLESDPSPASPSGKGILNAAVKAG